MQPLSHIFAAIFEDSAAKSYDHELLCDLQICPNITLCIKLILIIVHHVTPPRAPQKQTRNKKSLLKSTIWSLNTYTAIVTLPRRTGSLIPHGEEEETRQPERRRELTHYPISIVYVNAFL